jgi:WD40 repeat protein
VWRQPSAGKRAAGARLTMRGYPAKVHCLDWHPRRSRVATAGGSDVVVWDIPQTGPGRARPLRAHDAAVTALGYGPDGSVLASADRAGRVCLWRDGGDLLQTYVLGAEIAALAWSPDGRALALGCTDGRLHVQAPGG